LALQSGRSLQRFWCKMSVELGTLAKYPQC